MRARLSTIAVLVLLAGCVAPGGELDPQSGVPEIVLPPLERAQSLVVDATRWSGEPSILALADGTLLITGAGGMTRYAEDPADIPGNFGSSYLWRSVDEGATWQFVDLGLPAPLSTVLPYRNAILGVEGDLAQDEAGRAYFVDLTMLAANGVAASDDSGASWTAAQNPLVGLPGADRPWLAALGDGLVFMKYLQAGTGHRVAKSTDGGLTFPEDVLLPACGQGAPVADLAERTILIPCGSDEAVHLLRSPAEGAMDWQIVEALPVESDPNNVFLSAAVAGPGEYLLAWSQTGENGTATLRLAWSLDAGASWGGPVNVSTPDRTAVFPWVDANAEGVAGVVWYEADVGGASDEIDAAWRPMHAQLRLGADGLAVGATSVLADEKVHQGPICLSGLGCVLGGRGEDRRLLDFFEIDVDAGGRSHVTWTNTQTDVPTVWYGRVEPVS